MKGGAIETLNVRAQPSKKKLMIELKATVVPMRGSGAMVIYGADKTG